MYIKIENNLWNEEFFFWLINGEIRSGKLNFNSNLQELAEFLFLEYHIERSDYKKVDFLFQGTNYDDYNLTLADIGISSEYFIDVKENIFPLSTRTFCSLNDRDHYMDQQNGIRFELSLKNKIVIVFENCLLIIKNTGVTFIEALRYRLADTNNRFEINAIQQIMNEIQDLMQNFLTDVKKTWRKIE